MGTETILWYYQHQLMRLVEETLEASLIICRSEINEFSPAKLFDVFNQTFPTAFVLNTGYWPFFNTTKKQSICICGRYGLECRHFKQNFHWIDLEDLPNDHTKKFPQKIGYYLNINDTKIELIPITVGSIGYYLNINLTFQYKRNEENLPNKRIKIASTNNIENEQPFNIPIYSRYSLQREYYPAMYSIKFQPSPYFYPTYGTILRKLLKTRFKYAKNEPDCLIISADTMPQFTLVVQQANIPIIHPFDINTLMIVAELTNNMDNIFEKSSTNSMEFVKRGEDLVIDFNPNIWDNNHQNANTNLFKIPAVNEIHGGINFNNDFSYAEKDWNNPKIRKDNNNYNYKKRTSNQKLKFDNISKDDVLRTTYASVVKSSAKSGNNNKKNGKDFLKMEKIKQETLDENFEIAEEFIQQEFAKDGNLIININ